MRRLALVLLAGLFLAGPLWAGSFRTNDISATAKWTAHLDVDQIVNSQLGRMVINEILKEEGLNEKRAAFKSMFGFDPLEDVRSITVWGRGFQEKEGVALFKGNFNQEKLLVLVEANGFYAKQAYRTYEIHEWEDNGKTQYGTFYGGDMVIIGNKPGIVELALDVLDAQQPTLGGGGALKGLDVLPGGAWFVGSVVDFGEAAGQNPQAALLKTGQQITIVAGESSGVVYAEGTLKTKDNESAQQVHQVLQGILAFGMLMREKVPIVADLAQAAQLNVNGPVVKIRGEMASEQLFNLLKKAHQMEQQKKQNQPEGS